jgi:hypothetical protein
MRRALFLTVIAVAVSVPASAEPITVRPTPTALTPVIEPLSYTPAPESARVTDQYRDRGLVFAHTALGTANGVTSWMPTGDGWWRYTGAPADPFENQFNFYLGYRGVVAFDFVNPTSGAPDPVHTVRFTVSGVGPVELAAAYETANGGWGGNPTVGVLIPDGSALEFTVSGNDISRLSVYQMLKVPYPDVPNAWGVTSITYDRVGVTADTPEPASVAMGAMGLAAVGFTRLRRRAGR